MRLMFCGYETGLMGDHSDRDRAIVLGNLWKLVSSKYSSGCDI